MQFHRTGRQFFFITLALERPLLRGKHGGVAPLPAEDSRELAADRLLILSGFPQGTPDSRENLRARCNIMNSLAAALCSKAAEMA